MAPYTKTKINRLFDYDLLNGGAVRKEHPEPADPRTKKSCRRCGLPMMVSPGQIANYHGHCRTNGRIEKKI